MMAPTFSSVAALYPLKVLFVKVDTEQHQQLGAKYNIRSISTLVIFKNGIEAERASGALNSDALKSSQERMTYVAAQDSSDGVAKSFLSARWLSRTIYPR